MIGLEVGPDMATVLSNQIPMMPSQFSGWKLAALAWVAAFTIAAQPIPAERSPQETLALAIGKLVRLIEPPKGA
ncbi:MAG: hypothetical protein ACYDC1_16185, partial [Limisphaerales bacterium]